MADLGDKVLVGLREQLIGMVKVRFKHGPRALTKGIVHRAQVEERPARRLVEPEAGVAKKTINSRQGK